MYDIIISLKGLFNMKKIKAIFFDLDGTLLPMNEEKFTNLYFGLLTNKVSEYGYDKDLLIKTIYQGTKLMYQNNGPLTNENVFWNNFVKVYGIDKLKDKPLFDEFYNTDFLKTKDACLDNPYAREIIDYCKESGIDVYLTTNPIFPYHATINRMSFIGLKEDDFKLITAYNNSINCKPNPQYFIDILNKYNLDPSEVILFGNNILEDGYCSYKAGIKCYMVGDFIITNNDVNIEFEHINLNEVIDIIKKYQ